MSEKELFGISEQLSSCGYGKDHVADPGKMVGDLISRAETITLFEKYGATEDAIALLESLPSAQQWIPCSERLPYAEYGESDTVLTTCGYRDVEDTSVRWIRLLYFNGGNWCYPTGETYEAKVYAWMPLPEPWKGDRDNVHKPD